LHNVSKKAAEPETRKEQRPAFRNKYKNWALASVTI